MLLAGAPSLRIGNCCDVDFSFNTFAVSIYPQPHDDAPPPAKMRKQWQEDQAFIKRKFAKEDGAIAFALVVSPLVKNNDADLLPALFSCIVPQRQLQRGVAHELRVRGRHIDILRHIERTIEGTLTPPNQAVGGFGALATSPVDDHEAPAGSRDPGYDAGSGGASCFDQGGLPHPGGGGADGKGPESKGEGEKGAAHELTEGADFNKGDEPASSSTGAATSPFARSLPGASPSATSSIKFPDYKDREESGRQHGAHEYVCTPLRLPADLADLFPQIQLDYLIVSPLARQYDHLPIWRRPGPPKPTRWIRSDKSQPPASSNEREIPWTELTTVQELVSSSDYRVFVARSSDAGIELVFKEEIIRVGDDPMNTVRNEAATYDALAAADFSGVCAPYVGLYEVFDKRPRSALVTKRWGEPLSDWNNLR